MVLISAYSNNKSIIVAVCYTLSSLSSVKKIMYNYYRFIKIGKMSRKFSDKLLWQCNFPRKKKTEIK